MNKEEIRNTVFVSEGWLMDIIMDLFNSNPSEPVDKDKHWCPLSAYGEIMKHFKESDTKFQLSTYDKCLEMITNLVNKRKESYEDTVCDECSQILIDEFIKSIEREKKLLIKGKE